MFDTNITVDDGSQSLETPRGEYHVATATSAQVITVYNPLQGELNNKTHTIVFFFSSGHRNQVTCSLLGGFSKARV